ncbi:MAG: prepilin peptidase [Methylobacteriaceae bacterium]|nr:prepilin peptidase [Methylobacteriaceae bacterium]
MIEIALLIVFPALVLFAGASDLLTMTIPNRVSLALVAGFVSVAAIGGLSVEAIALHVAAGAAVLVVTFLMFARGWVGGGDAKLASATALWLGFGQLPDYLYIAAMAGGALSLVILAFRRLPRGLVERGGAWCMRFHDPASGVPYGVALAAAALAVYPQTELWLAALSR